MLDHDQVLNKYQNWYTSMIAEGEDSFEKFDYHIQKQLNGFSLRGKRILEVGCGKGALSLYLALLSGAQQVVALDEAAGEGAPVGVNQVLRDAVYMFCVDNLTVVDVDIMRNDFADESFDFIIANNALHHVVNTGLISRNPAARHGYTRMFLELKRLLASDGILCVNEASRLCFWRWSPVKYKWNEIDWGLHPTRREWLSFIREAGFSLQSCKYTVPYSFRHFEKLIANPFAQFMLFPSFIITARK